MNKTIRALALIVERYYPDAFVFAILMSVLALLMAFTLTESSSAEILLSWGDGLPALMAFTAQLSITLLAAHALAHTDAMQSVLRVVGALPRSATSAYILVVFSASLGSLIAWSLGLVVGATLAREVAIQCAKKNITVHFPLLVASAYAGFVVWHMGYSASAPLFVATPGHTLEDVMGVLAITETVFTWQNLSIIIATIVSLLVVCPLMHPSDDQCIQIDLDTLQQDQPINDLNENPTFTERLETSRTLTLALGAALLLYILMSFYNKGFYLTLDIVNWSLVGFGLILARSPIHYVSLIYKAGTAVAAIIIQYPFYAGMLGIMTGTGLVQVMSGWFVENASSSTLALYAFLSAGVVNLFIPSGGGQWAIQGPVFIDAANQLSVAPELIVMAIAYGDQWSNMIQPFWTIPLLAIAGLHVRQIIGYTLIIFLVTGVVFGTGLFLWGIT